MKPLISICFIFFGFCAVGRAGLPEEIARIDASMEHSREIAKINGERARQNATDSFFRILDNLERQFQAAGHLDGVLACRKCRSTHDPAVPEVQEPIELVDPLPKLESLYVAEIQKLKRQESENILGAQKLRRERLTSILRGLTQRGDEAGARLIREALKEEPSLRDPNPPVAPPVSPAVSQFTLGTPIHLTYNREDRRWQKLEQGRVETDSAEGLSTVRYVEGPHNLLKVLWAAELHSGERFSVELDGAHSLELMALELSDGNVHIRIPPADSFSRLEIQYLENDVTFTLNGRPVKAIFMSGSLRGEEAKKEVLSHPLFPVFSLEVGEAVRYRGARKATP